MSNKNEQFNEVPMAVGYVGGEVPGYQQAPPQAPQNHDSRMYASPQAATGYAGISKQEIAVALEEEGKKRWKGMNPDKGEEHESSDTLSAVQGTGQQSAQPPMQGAAYMGQPAQPPMQGAAYMGQSAQPPMQGTVYMGQPAQPPMQGAAYMGQPAQPPMQGTAYMGQPAQPPMQGAMYMGQPAQPLMQGAVYMGQPAQPPMQGAVYMGQPAQPPMQGATYMYPSQQAMNRPVMPHYAAPMMPPAMPQEGKAKQEGHACNGGDRNEDAGIFGMIKQMVDQNPQLSSLSQYANVTNSEFIKGLLLGAGVALLLSNNTVKDLLGGFVSGLFGEKEQARAEVPAVVVEETMEVPVEAPIEVIKKPVARDQVKKESGE